MSKWQDRTITDLAKFINGYAFKPSDWSKEGLPIVRIEQLKNPESEFDYYSGSLPKHNIINNGDLIFSWSASLFLKFWSNGKAALNQHLFKVENYDDVDKFFLKYLIEFYLPELTKAAHGSTMQHITRKELNKFRVKLPIEKTTQSKIAAVLSSIDKAIEQTEKLIEKQKRIKRGLLHDLLTKGIDERGAIRSEATHEFKDSPLGRIPKDWDISGLREKQSSERVYLRTGPFGSSLKGSDWVEDGVPVVTIGSLGEGEFIASELLFITQEKANLLSSYKLKSGDIVFSRVADVGRSAVVTNSENDWIMSSNMMRISLDKKKVLPKFVYLNIVYNENTKRQIRESVNSSGRDVANSAVMNSLLFAWAEIDEQERIIEMLEKIETNQNEEIYYLHKLKAIKIGLMQDLLTENAESRISNLL